MFPVKKIRTVIADGLSLVIIEVPGARSARIQFIGKSGSRYDPEGKEGLAHFLEHILLKKTKKYFSATRLSHSLESFGGWRNGWTNREELAVFVDCAAKHMEKATEVLSEMILAPLIDEKGVDAERKVIEKEIVRKQSRPEDLVWDLYYGKFFSNSSLKLTSLGTMSSLKNIRVGDLEAFWRTNFVTKDSVLLVASPFKPSKVKEMVEKSFAKGLTEDGRGSPLFKYKRKDPVSLKYFDLPQTAFLLGFKLETENFNEIHSLAVLRDVLAAGWGCRFSQRLRIKESLVYGWWSTLRYFLDNRSLIFKLATAKEDFHRLLEVTVEELIKVRDKKISERELKRVKGYMEGSLLRNMETPSDYMGWYDTWELLWPDEAKSVENWIEGVKAVTADQVQQMARKYFQPDNWYLAVVGSVKKQEIKLKF